MTYFYRFSFESSIPITATERLLAEEQKSPHVMELLTSLGLPKPDGNILTDRFITSENELTIDQIKQTWLFIEGLPGFICKGSFDQLRHVPCVDPALVIEFCGVEGSDG